MARFSAWAPSLALAALGVLALAHPARGDPAVGEESVQWAVWKAVQRRGQASLMDEVKIFIEDPKLPKYFNTSGALVIDYMPSTYSQAFRQVLFRAAYGDLGIDINGDGNVTEADEYLWPLLRAKMGWNDTAPVQSITDNLQAWKALSDFAVTIMKLVMNTDSKPGHAIFKWNAGIRKCVAAQQQMASVSTGFLLSSHIGWGPCAGYPTLSCPQLTCVFQAMSAGCPAYSFGLLPILTRLMTHDILGSSLE